MRRILCYGDSNTWGYTAGTGVRYPHDVCWTGVMQRELGAEYTVLEEGLNGRTSVFDNPFSPYRSGVAYLLPCLLTHRPLDVIVVMLGTNDLRWTTAFGASEGVRRIVKEIKLAAHLEESSSVFADQTRILVVSPILAHPRMEGPEFNEVHRLYPARSREFAAHFAKMAAETGCDFLDAAQFAEPSEVDGLHMTQESHARLGKAIADKVREMLEKER